MKSDPDKNIQIMNQVVNDLFKGTFGDNFHFSLAEDEAKGTVMVRVSTLIISQGELLKETFGLESERVALRMNEQVAERMEEIADVCLQLSNHIRSRLVK